MFCFAVSPFILTIYIYIFNMGSTQKNKGENTDKNDNEMKYKMYFSTLLYPSHSSRIKNQNNNSY